MPPPPRPPPPMEMYWPTGEATIISPGFSPVRRSMTAPCPAKIPRVGKVTAVVKPAPRAVSMRRSVAEISSAILTQLVVCGRSSGPRAGGAAAWVAVDVAGAAAVVAPRPPRPAVGRGGGRRAGLSPGAQGVDQAGIDGEAFALHQHGVGRNGDVFADGFNQSVANHHRALGDDRAGDGHNLRVVDGHCRMGSGQGPERNTEIAL